MIEKINLGTTIYTVYPDAKFSITDNDYSTLVWPNDNLIPKPTEEEINQEIERLQTEYEYNEYQRNRQPNYPSITDQLDMLWHAIDSGTLDKTSDFYLKLKEVKELYPKPLEEQNDNQ